MVYLRSRIYQNSLDITGNKRLGLNVFQAYSNMTTTLGYRCGYSTIFRTQQSLLEFCFNFYNNYHMGNTTHCLFFITLRIEVV